MHEIPRFLRRHRSIRRYTDEPVAEADVLEAVRAGQAASTSSAIQAYGLLRVRDEATRARLVELTGQQTKVARAGAFFVVLGDARRHRLLCARAGAPYDTRLEGFLLAVVDASLFAQNLVVAFEAMGYGICYIGGLRNHLADVVDLLELPEGVYPLYGLCVGRPAEEPLPRPRLPPEAVLHEERYADDEAVLAAVDGYDETYAAWLEQRGATPRAWSEAMVAQWSTPRRVDLARVYEGQGARLD